MCLVVDATIDHVGNARKLAQLALAHDAYHWIGGGVQVNDHTAWLPY